MSRVRASKARWLGLAGLVAAAGAANCDGLLGIGDPIVRDASTDGTLARDAGHADADHDSRADANDGGSLNATCAELYACCAVLGQPQECDAVANMNVAGGCAAGLAEVQAMGYCKHIGSGTGAGSGTGSGSGSGSGTGSGTGTGTGSGGKGTGSGSAGAKPCQGPEQCTAGANPICCGASTSADAGLCAVSCTATGNPTGEVPRCASATDCTASLVCCIPVNQSYGSCIDVAQCAGLVDSPPHLPHFGLCNIKSLTTCPGGTCEVATCPTASGQTELTVCSTCFQACTAGCTSPSCASPNSCCPSADGGATCSPEACNL